MLFVLSRVLCRVKRLDFPIFLTITLSWHPIKSGEYDTSNSKKWDRRGPMSPVNDSYVSSLILFP